MTEQWAQKYVQAYAVSWFLTDAEIIQCREEIFFPTNGAGYSYEKNIKFCSNTLFTPKLIQDVS